MTPFETVIYTILHQKLDTLETTALHIMLIYLEKSAKFFPNYKHDRFPTQKSILKSSLFKNAYKFVRESYGKIMPTQYRLYVHAQFDIIHAIHKQTENSTLLSPNVIAGDKAWRRWLLWKRKYDETVKVNKSEYKMDELYMKKLWATKEFLKNNNVDKSNLSINIDNIQRWHRLGLVSTLYLALSPVIREQISNVHEFFSINEQAVAKTITPEIIHYFRQEFSHEFHQ